MSRWQDDWKTIYQTQEEWLRQKKDDPSEVVLEVAQETGSDDEESPTFQVYRFDVPRLKVVQHDRHLYLVPLGYDKTWPHPVSAYEEWFADNLEDVARTAGRTQEEMIEDLTSDDPRRRARAYIDIGSHHGFANFDTDPLELDEEKLDKRWG